jgi:hypothetical protein
MAAKLGGTNTKQRSKSVVNGRIKLSDNFQWTMFRDAMNMLNRNKRRLSDYDRELYQKLRDGYDFSGRELTITVKQLNHIKQVAMELESGRYDNGR